MENEVSLGVETMSLMADVLMFPILKLDKLADKVWVKIREK